MAFIEFQNVSYSVENKNILKNINLKIEEGEFVAILGANGSGKSTLAKLINGLLKPSSGKIIIDNLDTNNKKNLQDIRQKVGYIFQNPDNQIIENTVEDDVAFGPENLNLDVNEIEKRINHSLNLVGLTDKRNYSPYMLSSGEKQKLVIAGVLAMNTKAIIFDEATSILDSKSKEEVINNIVKLNKENKITIIYISHSIEEILNADKIVIINNGKIEIIGNAKEIFSDSDIIKKFKNWCLELPFAYYIAKKLRDNNIAIFDDIYDEQSLIFEIKNLR